MRSNTDIVIMAILGLLVWVFAFGWWGQRGRVLELEGEIARIGDCEMELQACLDRLLKFYGKEAGEEEIWKEAADWSQ